MKVKGIISLVAMFFAIANSQAQVAMTSVVEHFTNTSCSICASNNNTYYNIINNHPSVLHISFHPSSPYSNDYFNLQNQAENDARTNFYGVYGATPRLVVNGTVTQNLNLNTTLDNAISALSNFELKVSQSQVSVDTLGVRVTVIKVASDTTTVALFFAGAMEDTIFQTTNNGESVHYNVFRKALTAASGNPIQLPAGIGDSVVVDFSYTIGIDWNSARMQTMGILQHLNRSIINSARSTGATSVTNVVTNDGNLYRTGFFVPNPARGKAIHSVAEVEELKIYTFTGHLLEVKTDLKTNQEISVEYLPSGIYLFETIMKGMHCFQKVIIL